MRIANVSAGIVEIPPKLGGGTELHILSLSKELVKRSHDIVIIGSGENRTTKYVDSVAIDKLPFTYKDFRIFDGRLNPIINEYRFGKELRKYEFSSFDIIHAHNLYAAIKAQKIARKRNIPFIYTSHNPMWYIEDTNAYERYIVRKLERKLIKKADAFITISENMKENIARKAKLDPKEIEVVYNGVDINEFHPDLDVTEIKAKYGIKETDKVILFVGKVGRSKGLEYLIKAADIIVNKLSISKVKFFFVGPISYEFGEQREVSKYYKELIDLVEKSFLQDYVKFTGSVLFHQLKQFYSIADIFVLPSLVSAFELVLLEASASGNPIIGSNVGGIPEVIEKDKNGYLFNPTDYKTLAEKISSLLEDPSKINGMKKKSRKMAEEKFTWSNTAKQVEDIYKEVLKC